MPPTIVDSMVCDSASVIDSAAVYKSTLYHNSMAKDFAIVEHSVLYDDAIVEDTAFVSGVWLHGHTVIGGRVAISSAKSIHLYDGVWNRAPVIVSALHWPVYECEKGKIAIGCVRHTFAEWKELYESQRRRETIGVGDYYTSRREARCYWEAIKFIHRTVKEIYAK